MQERVQKKFIIITTIFPPTLAVEKFSALPGYHLVVVGDKKTPADWAFENCTYLDITAQLDLAADFANAIPFNHYGRKMIGYLYAMQQGADIIIDTDDDNIPYESWCFPGFEGMHKSAEPDLGWINIYQYFTAREIWPRGLPLRCIRNSREHFKWTETKSSQQVGIWQALTDGDADVDAIYRLTCDSPCFFDKKEPVVLKPGTIAPVNSQNTAFRKYFFPLLFLPSFVTFRFTDILRGIVAQPILWQHNNTLGFTSATVQQKRNEHDYVKDFASEVPMYLHSEKAFNTVNDSILLAR